MNKLLAITLFLLSAPSWAFIAQCKSSNIREFDKIALTYYQIKIEEKSSKTQFDQAIINEKLGNILKRSENFNQRTKCQELTSKAKDTLNRIKAEVEGKSISHEELEFIDA